MMRIVDLGRANENKLITAMNAEMANRAAQKEVTGLLWSELNLRWRFETGIIFGTYLIRTKLQNY